MKVKHINCERCNKEIVFKGGKHKYCDECLPIIKKERQRLRDWKRTVLKRQKEAEKRLCKCPACGVEFSRLSQGSKKTYCGRPECELQRSRIKNRRADKKRIARRKVERKDRLSAYIHDHKAVAKLDSEFVGERYIKCSSGKKFSYEFVKHCIESAGYILLSRDYINVRYPLKLKCPKGHVCEISFDSFFNKKVRCGVCKVDYKVKQATKPEMLINSWLKEFGVEYSYRTRTVINKQELDFFIPSKNVAIEVCGLYWHSEVKGGRSRRYHRDKYETCCKAGIRLLTIFSDELDKRPEAVKSRIASALGVYDYKVYARKTECRLIDNKTGYKFFNKYHVQGSSPAAFTFGLFYNNLLVAVMSFGMLSRSNAAVDGSITIELKRYACLPMVSVVGGASKLNNRAERYIKAKYSEAFVKSFCDLRYSKIDNTLYDILGFDLFNESKYTPHYISHDYINRYRNQTLRKRGAEKNLDKSEWELRRDQGYDRIWDCGQRSYIKFIK